MKRYYILCVACLLLIGNTHAQKRRVVKKDILGNTIIIDKEGKTTTIKKDIFDNTVIETDDNKITIGRDIFGYLQYKDVSKTASLTKDIFDDWFYKDSNGNEIKYSKEFWADIKKDFRNNEEKLFMWLLDVCHNAKDFKEEYDVDIFGYLEYKNNQNEKASLRKDIFDNIEYKDSNGNEIEFSPREWNRILRRQGSQFSVFSDMVHRYLYAEE